MAATDKELAARSARGDDEAFSRLVGRYESQLSAVIRSFLRDPHSVEDVRQETLIQAWQDIGNFRDPSRVKQWLTAIARNRCRDFLRSAKRRELATAPDELARLLNRSGRTSARVRELADGVTEAMAELPGDARDSVRLFYLEGHSIDETARRQNCPAGTVKRRLHDARRALRQRLCAGTTERKTSMTARRRGAKRQPFPLTRPDIAITHVEGQSFSINCPELRWWSVIPELGERAIVAEYRPPDWDLVAVSEMVVTRSAEVHGVEGVEIDVSQWEPETGWRPSALQMIGRLTSTQVEYLATLWQDDRKISLQTFADEGYRACWGNMSRRIETTGTFVVQEDGSVLRIDPEQFTGGAGVFSVALNGTDFTCVRVFELEGRAEAPDSVFTESYVSREGRTVLRRHYCHEQVKGVAVDRARRIVVDGVQFVHWYDGLSGTACLGE